MTNYDILKEYEAHQTPVPSYEEWQAKLEENEQLKERNDSLNNRDINLCRIANGIRDENFALKELLKECQGSIATLLAKRITEVNGIKQKELLTKIDEALR